MLVYCNFSLRNVIFPLGNHNTIQLPPVVADKITLIERSNKFSGSKSGGFGQAEIGSDYLFNAYGSDPSVVLTKILQL